MSIDELGRDEQLKALVLREITKDEGLRLTVLTARLWATTADISRALEDLQDEGRVLSRGGGETFWTA